MTKVLVISWRIYDFRLAGAAELAIINRRHVPLKPTIYSTRTINTGYLEMSLHL